MEQGAKEQIFYRQVSTTQNGAAQRASTVEKGGYMSLRDEIESLIAQERNQLEAQDQIKQDLEERKKQRFKIMRSLLQELVDSLEPECIRANLLDKSVEIKFGYITIRDIYSNPEWLVDTEWYVCPNWESGFLGSEKQWEIKEKDGFWVNEKTWTYIGSRERWADKACSFLTEAETLEYLTKQIAKRFAYYRHHYKK
jgi:hypothetical protein